MFPRHKNKTFRPTMIPDCKLWLDSSFQHLGVKSGNSAQFVSANSEYLSVTDTAALSMGDVDFEIGTWVYLDTTPASGATMGILGKWASGNLEYVLYVDNTGGTIRFKFDVRDTANAATTTVTASTFATPSPTTWYWVMVYHNATTNLIGIAVNDGAYDTAATTGGVRDGTAAFEIGRHTAGNYFNGRVQKVLITKDILTAAERTWLYNSGNQRRFEDFGQAGTDGANLTVAGGIVAGWKLGEESGQRNDYFGTNHLTDNATVTQNDGAVLDDAVDGDYVRQWSDLSGNGNHATQTGNVTTKPIFKTGILNGKPVLRFDGVNDYMTITALDNGSAETMVVVAKRTGGDASYQAIINSRRNIIYGRLNTDIWGSFQVVELSSGQNISSDYKIITLVARASNDIDFYTNGANKVTLTTGSGLRDVAISVGAGNPSVQFFGGDISEIIPYNRELNAGELNRLTRYAGRKYGIAVS